MRVLMQEALRMGIGSVVARGATRPVEVLDFSWEPEEDRR
jgi:hypothetical protein